MTCWHGYAVINLPEGSCRQRISQRIPGRGGNLLGALAQVRQRHQPCIVGRRLFQIKGWMLLGQPAAQCPTQHLAALRIGCGQRGLQLGNGGRVWPGQRHHAHHAGIHLRWRVEGFRRHVEELYHLVMVLQEDGESPHVAAGTGHNAVDHLFLQHEVLVPHTVCHGNEMQQQRAGDVVGQIADDAQILAETAEIDLQHVLLHQGQCIAILRSQPGPEIAVDLNDGDMARLGHQRRGQYAGAGANLDKVVAEPGSYGLHDGIDAGTVCQEVLAEALAGNDAGRALLASGVMSVVRHRVRIRQCVEAASDFWRYST